MPVISLITYLAPFIGFREREYGAAYMKVGIKGLILGALDFLLLLILAIFARIAGTQYLASLFPLLVALVVWAIKGYNKVLVPAFSAMLAVLFLDVLTGGAVSQFLGAFIPVLSMDQLAEALYVIPTDFVLVLLGGFVFDIVSGANTLTEEVSKRL